MYICIMIFITGGTGLVGSHILLKLSIQQRDFIALKRNSSSLSVCRNIFSNYNSTHLFEKIKWIDGDINDVSILKDAMVGCQYIIHCAAIVSFHHSDLQLMHKINIEGTANVMNLALDSGIKKCVYISSVATLGYEPNTVIDETSYFKHQNNNSNYAITKYYAEQEVWRASAEGLKVVIVNPSIILGPGNWNKGSSKIFKKIYDGLRFYSQGGSGYVDVVDVADAVVKLLFSNIHNERFILNSVNLSYRTCFDKIADYLKKPRATVKVTPLIKEISWRLELLKSIFTGEKPLITKETAHNAMIFRKYSNKKIKEFIGFEFIPIEETIKKYSKWFIKDL